MKRFSFFIVGFPLFIAGCRLPSPAPVSPRPLSTLLQTQSKNNQQELNWLDAHLKVQEAMITSLEKSKAYIAVPSGVTYDEWKKTQTSLDGAIVNLQKTLPSPAYVQANTQLQQSSQKALAAFKLLKQPDVTRDQARLDTFWQHMKRYGGLTSKALLEVKNMNGHALKQLQNRRSNRPQTV